MAVHIFIDSSNIYGGAQQAAEHFEPHVQRAAIRLYYKNFFELLEANRDVVTKNLAGSITSNNAIVFEFAHSRGYDTDLLRRVEDDEGKRREQAVDEMLHLRIANALLDFDPPQTLVIASGDGREHRRDASFPRQIKRALRRGWQVELYSWADVLSPAFADIEASPEQFKIRVFDPHYDSITFFKGGRSTLHGAELDLTARVAKPLRKNEAGSYW